MPDLTPEQTRERTARLMADGRERTANDVALRIDMPVNQAAAALRALLKKGLIERDVVVSGKERTSIYRKRGF
jgi:hypothetical protein